MKITSLVLVLLLLSLAVAVSAEAGEEAAGTDGLIAHWKLDEGQGSVVNDSSGNGYHGELTNATWSTDVPPVPGAGDYSLRFGGTGYVDTAVFDINDDFTFAAWIRPEESSGNAILGKHWDSGANQFVIGLYDNHYHVRLHGVSDSLSVPLNGAWFHLTVTGQKREGSNSTLITIYRNGVYTNHFILGDLVGDVGGADNSMAWTIGQEWDPGGRSDFFKGNLADLRLYDHALDEAEIAAFTAGFATICTVPGDFDDVGSAMSSLPCDIIEIAAGEYEVDQRMPAQGLIVRGAGREETILNIERGAVRFGNLSSSHAFADLTIQGGGNHSGSREENGGAFAVGEKARLVLDNVAMIRNLSSANGGSIYNLGLLIIRDSLFEDNGAGTWQGSGGAIYSLGSIDVRDSVFRDNIIYAPAFPEWAPGSGGAIASRGTAVIEGTLFESNDSGGGGALHNHQLGDMIIKQSVIKDNQSFDNGGAIINRGKLLIEDSTLSGNHAWQSGGALYNYKDTETIIRRSTISGSSARHGLQRASAIHNWGGLQLENSTITGSFFSEVNTLKPNRAVIYQQWYTASLTLLHTTIAANKTAENSTNERGLWVLEGTIEARNSILSGNGEVNCFLEELTWTGHSGSLAGDDSCDGLPQTAGLALGPLRDNGGPTQTMAIGPDSTAYDAADPAHCLPTDQRGVQRDPAHCDAGAYQDAGGLIHLPVIRADGPR